MSDMIPRPGMAIDWTTHWDGKYWRVTSRTLGRALDDEFRHQESAAARAMILNAFHGAWSSKRDAPVGR